MSRLSKDGQVIWFPGADNYFPHPADESLRTEAAWPRKSRSGFTGAACFE
ncbi:MAG: hypothetical protein Q8Q59_02355 [Luteolibacter sp.]|nr:hypothetical protein [Luteolibacter sp.]